ncbi:VOC family protein [Noviherbaspirillum cavernae]|uniref:VOC family protein n=1 Tax=Noviherbaspirillum cavernae TaxID=2320862 RepID=A0A418X2U5_9BURK|nr:VOC family protein [Noviherbaspirillum cavernae]RJG06783.1 VOC family protein [Noviherbaspirillum cavernae]
MSDLGLTHVALPAVSLDASIAFYARYASMKVVHQRHDVVWLSDLTRAFAIVLIKASSVPHPLQPCAHLGVGVASRDEVDRLCALAGEEGCLLREPQDYGPPVGYWALIRDPDGHTLEVAHGQEVAFTIDCSAHQSDESPHATDTY